MAMPSLAEAGEEPTAAEQASNPGTVCKDP
jgi:hypothetical protein